MSKRWKRKGSASNNVATATGNTGIGNKKKSTTVQNFSLGSQVSCHIFYTLIKSENVLYFNQNVMVVGEPSLMGGEFGDEDERLITRLENAQFEATNGLKDPNHFDSTGITSSSSSWTQSVGSGSVISGPSPGIGSSTLGSLSSSQNDSRTMSTSSNLVLDASDKKSPVVSQQ